MSKPTHITSKDEVYRGSISRTSTGEVVPAKAGKRIKIIAAVINAAGGLNTVTWRGGAADTLSGAMDIPSDTTIILPFNPIGWVANSVMGENMNLVLGSATLVAGHVTAVYEDVLR